MNILLVDPDLFKVQACNEPTDDRLLYPPLGLMKLSTYHKQRGDQVKFVRGCDKTIIYDLFNEQPLWDRVYICTVFTYNFRKIVSTINFYKEAVGGTVSKIFVGGIAASLIPNEIFEETGIYPVEGLLTNSNKIGFIDQVNIDQLVPDYSILSKELYAINSTFYAYATKGCVNKCAWCAVPTLEPVFVPYVDIKPIILELRERNGDKSKLKLMDNNVLASSELDKIVDDLLFLGYGKNDYTNTSPRKKRSIDFNQGIDASFVTEKNMKLLSRLCIKPMRIAFDDLQEKNDYTRAIEIAYRFGVDEFSNYLLYDFKDNPRSLYERMKINIRINEKWKTDRGRNANIYSYPMRYAHIKSTGNNGSEREDVPDTSKREDILDTAKCSIAEWFADPSWTKRFKRSIEIMKGAANGAISPTTSLAWRTIGETFEEFITNLYMPEELLRNRNKHEKRTYLASGKRGSGLIEEFRQFLLSLVRNNDQRFYSFHNAVSTNSMKKIKEAINNCMDKELRRWLKYYTLR